MPTPERLRVARRSARALRRAASELSDVRREAAANRPRPPAAGLVVDVGAGQATHPRADVVVDKYVVDDFERGAPLDLSRPLVVADGARLPFADRAFAYSIASHVLEHAPDPAAFAAELARVAPRGFVQVPSAVAELTFGWPFHPWLVERHGDALHFTPRGEARAPYGDLFHRLYAGSALLRLFWGAHRSLFHLSVEWEGVLAVEVAGESSAERTAGFDVERTLASLRAAAEMGRVRGPDGPVLEALRCPVCRGALGGAAGALQCGGCARAFPVAGTVPVLVEEAAMERP